jgi:hypothetical protein
MGGINVQTSVLDQFNEEKERVRKLRQERKLSQEEFIIELIGLSRKVNK